MKDLSFLVISQKREVFYFVSVGGFYFVSNYIDK